MLCTASIHVVSATLDPSDPEYWDDVGDATLYKGDTYDAKGYTVAFLDYESIPFEGDFVFVQLRRGDHRSRSRYMPIPRKTHDPRALSTGPIPVSTSTSTCERCQISHSI